MVSCTCSSVAAILDGVSWLQCDSLCWTILVKTSMSGASCLYMLSKAKWWFMSCFLHRYLKENLFPSTFPAPWPLFCWQGWLKKYLSICWYQRICWGTECFSDVLSVRSTPRFSHINGHTTQFLSLFRLANTIHPLSKAKADSKCKTTGLACRVFHLSSSM